MEENKKKSILDNRYIDLVVVVALSFLITLVGQTIGTYIFYGITLLVGGGNPVMSTASLYLIFIGIWLVLILYLMLTKKNRPILKALGKRPKGNNLKMALVGIFFGAGLNLICAFVAILNGDIHIYFDNFNILIFIFLLIAVGIQSGAEEITDRMFVYQRIRRSFKNKWVALAINATVFAATHLSNPGITPLSFLNLALVGVLYTLMVYYFDSLWCPIIAHTTWNFTQNILLGLPNSGNVVPYSIFKLDAANAVNSFAYNTGFGLEGTVTACALIAASCVGIIIWGEKNKKSSLSVWEMED